MNKYSIITIILGVIAFGGIFSLLRSSTLVAQNKRTPMVTQNQATPEVLDSQYVVYAPSILDQSTADKRILFFYASWCPTCRPVDQALRMDTNALPENVMVIRVNYNDTETDQEEKELAKKYGITYQHTFVQIDKSGTEIKKWNGGGVAEIATNIQ